MLGEPCERKPEKPLSIFPHKRRIKFSVVFVSVERQVQCQPCEVGMMSTPATAARSSSRRCTKSG